MPSGQYNPRTNQFDPRIVGWTPDGPDDPRLDGLSTVSAITPQAPIDLSNQVALRNAYLQRMYGTKDKVEGSPTQGQYQPLDQLFLALLNDRSILPAPIQTTRAENPALGAATQQQRSRKLDFMTQQNPMIPPGPPHPRDNGQAIARRSPV